MNSRSLVLCLTLVTLPLPCELRAATASREAGESAGLARAWLHSPRTGAQVAPSPTGIDADCTHLDDNLWWNGFALPTLSGTVNALATDGADLIVGGSFTVAGLVHASRVARWNGSAWSALGAGPPNTCNALTQWNAHLVAGCDASDLAAASPTVFEFDGSTWLPLGTFQGPGFAPRIMAMTTLGGDLIAGGGFGHADGDSTGPVARWDGAHWRALGAGCPAGFVRALAEVGSRLFAGGTFADGSAIKQWDGSTWSDVGAGLQYSSNPAGVYALLSDGTNLYASGQINQSGGVTFTGLPSWDGSTWSSLGSSVGAASSTGLGFYNGNIVASEAGAAGGMGMWDGSSWVTIPPGPTTIQTTLQQWGALLVTAEVTSLVGVPLTSHVAAYDGATWSPILVPWSPGTMAGADAELTSALNWHGQLVVAGFGMQRVGAQDHFDPSSSVAAWDGGAWASLGAPSVGFAGLCGSIVDWHDSLVVGLYSSVIAGINVHRIGRWDGSSWAAIGQGFNGEVHAVAVHNDELYAFGRMTASGTTTVNGLARWDGSQWQALGSGLLVNSGEYPNAARSWGSDLILAGEFDQVSGVAAANIARWDGSSWHPLGSGLDDEADCVAEFAGDLVVGGPFTMAGGVPAAGVARWNGSSWAAMGDNAIGVAALRVVDGRLFAGGTFRCPDGGSVNGLAIWSGTNWELTGSGVDGRIDFIEPFNGDIYVGGVFAWANERPSFGIARWMGASLLAVDKPAAPLTPTLRNSGRNPSGSGFDLEFAMPVAGYGRLEVFDLAGRRVARLREGILPAGVQHARWAGIDAAGTLSSSGLYFARLETAIGVRTVRLLLAR